MSLKQVTVSKHLLFQSTNLTVYIYFFLSFSDLLVLV